jgi:hypothetical protein
MKYWQSSKVITLRPRRELKLKHLLDRRLKRIILLIFAIFSKHSQTSM